MSTVNNLNIFTFIKDIYMSLKNIDKTLNISNEEINKRISKIEENQQILLDKITNVEIVLNRIGEMNKPNSGLDKNIEFELLEKMKRLNQNEINNSKLALKPNELTFANILENNYSFNDIGESISTNTMHNNFTNTTMYTNLDTPSDTYMFIEDILENNSINNNNNINNNTKNESLDTLLF